MIPRFTWTILMLPLVAAAGQPASRQPAPQAVPAQAAPQQHYGDLADLALPASVVAHVRLRRAVPLRPAEAVGVAPGNTRFYMEADVVALIRGEPGMPTQIKYLIDLANDPNGRPVRPVRRSEWLIFARTVAGSPGDLQLIARDAQLPYTIADADQIRAILREALSPDAPRAITGIGRAFHVPGVLHGSSETQIFLLTAQNQPVSLTIRREPNLDPRWFVSLTEFVDAGATQPEPNTLLWYRLACTLPARLPPASLSEAPEHAAAIAADYGLVLERLGTCQRARSTR